MKIGNVEIKNKAFLAPMAGTTDLPYRLICKRYGAAMLYSEMVSAKGLYYKDKKTADLMVTTDIERPFAIQIFGSDPEIMASVIDKVMEISNPDIIDVNMGCPTPKIVNNGDGSAILKNPKLAGEIMNVLVKVSPVPITAKIRKGWDDSLINAVEVAKILEANGAAAVAIHGRTRMDFYSGTADWDIIKDIKSAVKIPVIGNGDIKTAYDAKKMLDYTGCDAVMIGRAAQGNPFIFRQINELLETGSLSYMPSDEERLLTAIEHVRDLVNAHGERRGVCEARKHIAWYIKGMKNASQLKSKVFTINDFDTLNITLTDYLLEIKT